MICHTYNFIFLFKKKDKNSINILNLNTTVRPTGIFIKVITSFMYNKFK